MSYPETFLSHKKENKMSYTLTEEQQLIQQNACEFAKEYIEPVTSETDHDYKYPADVIEKLAENDFFGLFLPNTYGGSDAGYLSYVLTIEEIAKVNAGVAAVILNHASLAAYAINKFGSDAQKKAYLPALCKGEKIGAFAWTEKGHAAGAGADSLKAVKDGDNYVLNGKKCYIENGGVAGVYVAFAVTDPSAGKDGLSAFIVDGNAAGLKVVRKIEKMGLRACPCAELEFSNVIVPAANLIAGEGRGFDVMKDAKSAAYIAEGALVAGAAQAALTEAANYAKQRIQFKRPIASFPAIQNLIADIAANIHLTKLAVYHAASLLENGERFEVESNIIKYFATRIGTKALIDAIQVEGGVGFCDDMQVSRIYRDINGVFLTDSSMEFAEPVIAAEVLV